MIHYGDTQVWAWGNTEQIGGLCPGNQGACSGSYREGSVLALSMWQGINEANWLCLLTHSLLDHACPRPTPNSPKPT